jgi:hypothetical protein
MNTPRTVRHLLRQWLLRLRIWSLQHRLQRVDASDEGQSGT